MCTSQSSLPGAVSRWGAGLATAVLCLALAACGADGNDAGPSDDPSSTPASSQTASTDADETSPPAESSSAADEHEVVVTVEGEKGEALVKALVLTSDSKQGGPMLREELPFSHEVTLPAGTDLTKVLVIAKYPDGGTGELSCAVSIDGETVAEDSSRGHQPAKCHVMPR